MRRNMNKIIAVFAVILTFFSIASPAEAFGRGRIFGRGRFFGGCGHSVCSTCAPVVVEEIVEVPVFAFPILVPAFQFQYVPPAFAAGGVLPVAGGGYPVVQSGGYGASYGQFGQASYGQYGQASYGQFGQSYGQSYGQSPYGQTYGQSPYAYNQSLNLNSKDKIRELARALLEEMNKAENGNGNDTGPPAVPGTQSYQPPPQPPPNPYQPQPPYQQPNPYQSQQPPPQQLQQLAFSAMARTCARCHTGVGSKHDVVIFTQPGLVNQHANWRKIKEEVASGRMPPRDTHFQLAPQERQWIVQWLNSIGVN
jgi:hypothetical protein